MLDAAALDEWLRGQRAATRGAIDGFTVEGDRGELFGVTVSPVTGRPVIDDLTVFDLTGGRDHGVDDHDGVREVPGPSTCASSDAWGRDNGVSRQRPDALRELHGDPKLDTHVGVLREKDHGDGRLGITSTILVAMQFAAVRDGDRFWHENRFADDPGVSALIEGGSMAGVIERITAIEHVHRGAFLAHERTGGTDGEEEFDGTHGRDLLIGLGGNDDLNGRRDADDLHGGAGQDVLPGGGAGDDGLDGDPGSDGLTGAAGREQFASARRTPSPARPTRSPTWTPTGTTSSSSRTGAASSTAWPRTGRSSRRGCSGRGSCG